MRFCEVESAKANEGPIVRRYDDEERRCKAKCEGEGAILIVPVYNINMYLKPQRQTTAAMMFYQVQYF